VPSKGDGDKITLPTSALQALTSQDATGLGPMLFELSIPAKGADQSPRVTHGGVLEFVAAEGTVGLPLKVCTVVSGRYKTLRFIRSLFILGQCRYMTVLFTA
jgi:Ubiquitin fusion degradation protein UFD1